MGKRGVTNSRHKDPNGVLFQKLNVIRLYTPWKEGGRGLISIQECVESEHKSLDSYWKSEETHLKYVVKSKNLLKESTDNKREYRKSELKETSKATETTAASWTVWEGDKRFVVLVD